MLTVNFLGKCHFYFNSVEFYFNCFRIFIFKHEALTILHISKLRPAVYADLKTQMVIQMLLSLTLLYFLKCSQSFLV